MKLKEAVLHDSEYANGIRVKLYNKQFLDRVCEARQRLEMIPKAQPNSYACEIICQNFS